MSLKTRGGVVQSSTWKQGFSFNVVVFSFRNPSTGETEVIEAEPVDHELYSILQSLTTKGFLRSRNSILHDHLDIYNKSYYDCIYLIYPSRCDYVVEPKISLHLAMKLSSFLGDSELEEELNRISSKVMEKPEIADKLVERINYALLKSLLPRIIDKPHVLDALGRIIKEAVEENENNVYVSLLKSPGYSVFTENLGKVMDSKLSLRERISGLLGVLLELHEHGFIDFSKYTSVFNTIGLIKLLENIHSIDSSKREEVYKQLKWIMPRVFNEIIILLPMENFEKHLGYFSNYSSLWRNIVFIPNSVFKTLHDIQDTVAKSLLSVFLDTYDSPYKYFSKMSLTDLSSMGELYVLSSLMEKLVEKLRSVKEKIETNNKEAVEFLQNSINKALTSHINAFQKASEEKRKWWRRWRRRFEKKRASIIPRSILNIFDIITDVIVLSNHFAEKKIPILLFQSSYSKLGKLYVSRDGSKVIDYISTSPEMNMYLVIDVFTGTRGEYLPPIMCPRFQLVVNNEVVEKFYLDKYAFKEEMDISKMFARDVLKNISLYLLTSYLRSRRDNRRWYVFFGRTCFDFLRDMADDIAYGRLASYFTLENISKTYIVIFRKNDDESFDMFSPIVEKYENIEKLLYDLENNIEETREDSELHEYMRDYLRGKGYRLSFHPRIYNLIYSHGNKVEIYRDGNKYYLVLHEICKKISDLPECSVSRGDSIIFESDSIEELLNEKTISYILTTFGDMYSIAYVRELLSRYKPELNDLLNKYAEASNKYKAIFGISPTIFTYTPELVCVSNAAGDERVCVWSETRGKPREVDEIEKRTLEARLSLKPRSWETTRNEYVNEVMRFSNIIRAVVEYIKRDKPEVMEKLGEKSKVLDEILSTAQELYNITTDNNVLMQMRDVVDFIKTVCPLCEKIHSLYFSEIHNLLKLYESEAVRLSGLIDHLRRFCELLGPVVGNNGLIPVKEGTKEKMVIYGDMMRRFINKIVIEKYDPRTNAFIVRNEYPIDFVILLELVRNEVLHEKGVQCRVEDDEYPVKLYFIGKNFYVYTSLSLPTIF